MIVFLITSLIALELSRLETPYEGMLAVTEGDEDVVDQRCDVAYLVAGRREDGLQSEAAQQPYALTYPFGIHLAEGLVEDDETHSVRM